MPERRPHLPAFRIRPRCCTSIAGLIYAVGGLNSAGTLQLPLCRAVLDSVDQQAPNHLAWPSGSSPRVTPCAHLDIM